MGRRNNWNVRSSPWDLHCPLVSLSNTLMLIQLYHCLETCWYFVMLHIYRGVGFYHSCSWEKVELLLKIHPLLSGLDLNGVSTVYISSVAIQFSDTVRSASSISLSCTACKRVDRWQISLWPLHQLVTYKEDLKFQKHLSLWGSGVNVRNKFRCSMAPNSPCFFLLVACKFSSSFHTLICQKDVVVKTYIYAQHRTMPNNQKKVGPNRELNPGPLAIVLRKP